MNSTIRGSLLIIVLCLTNACIGTKAAANESWRVVKILTKGEDIEAVSDVAVVRNCCGAVERKTVNCSAGTESNLSLSLGISVGGQVGAEIVSVIASVDPSVSTELGFSRDSGESLQLESPPEGFVYRYSVTKTYTVVAGQAVVQSSSGDEETVIYRFQAKCSLSIEPPQVMTCQEVCPQGASTPQPTMAVPTGNSVTSAPSQDLSPMLVPRVIPSLCSGGQLAFVQRINYTSSIFLINADGTGQVSLIEEMDENIYSPTWSPDGRRIAFVRSLLADIYVMDVDGSGLVNLTNDNPYNHSPTWSPDGRRIAFKTWDHYFSNDGFELTSSRLEVINANGTGRAILLTADPLPSFGELAWSPDGTRIVFEAANLYGSTGLFVMDSDGTNLMQLTTYGGSPDWSPDGTRIAFFSVHDGNAEIYVMNADGSQLTRVTNNWAGDWDPDWSPDGKKIAFVSNRNGRVRVFTMNADGTEQNRLTDNHNEEQHPDWRPCA